MASATASTTMFPILPEIALLVLGKYCWEARPPGCQYLNVRANSKSEARGLMKTELGIGRKGRLPAGTVVTRTK